MTKKYQVYQKNCGLFGRFKDFNLSLFKFMGRNLKIRVIGPYTREISIYNVSVKNGATLLVKYLNTPREVFGT